MTAAARICTRLGLVCVFIVLLMLGIGFAVRGSLLSTHFTNVDDIGVAAHFIQRAGRETELRQHARQEAQRLLAGERGSRTQQVAARLLERAGLFGIAVDAWISWDDWHSVARASTYAPGQFYLTRLLVSPEQNYEAVKAAGRLPSLAFGVLAMAAMVWFFVGAGDPAWVRERAVAGAALMALSWQCIAYAAQMESYSVGVFSVACLLLLMHWIVSRPALRATDGAVIGLAVGALATTQYQVLFFLPALFVAAAYAFAGRLSWRGFARPLVTAAAVFLLVTGPTVFPFLLRLTGAGVHHWNMGPAGEFVLDESAAGGGVAGALAGATWLALRNLPLVATAMLSPVEEGNTALPWISAALVVLMMIGFLCWARGPGRERRALAVFVAAVALTWIALLAARKITFGPSRHSMALIPIFVALASEGFGFIVGRLRSLGPRWQVAGTHGFALLAVLGWLGLFAADAPRELARRADPLTEASFLSRLARDRVQVVVCYEWSQAPYLMPGVRSGYPLFDWNVMPSGGDPATPVLRKIGRREVEGGARSELVVALYSHRQPFAADILRPLLETVAQRHALRGELAVEVLRWEVVESTTEIDWSSRTRNGTNALYYTVIRIRANG